jgi:protein-arginine kinase activator protein McsA
MRINPANIHLTQILQNETHVFHLCDECARKKGINISIQEELVSEESDLKEKIPQKSCSRCGLNFQIFEIRAG